MPIPVPKSVSPEVQSAPYKVGSTETTYGDFRDQLFNDGWVVIPNVIPASHTKLYISQAYDWLESFNLGFDRNDKSTHVASNLPFSYKGGLYSDYGSGHEQYAWDIRQEPGIIDAFAKIWGTEELLCSYDAVNLSVPLAKTEGNADIFQPWPHVDQSPTRRFLHCIQGIANLAPNGPADGGLMVLKGSKEYYNECFEKFAHLEPAEGWTLEDSYVHDEAMLDWLINEKGCTWHKVCCPEGGLILWDSRTVHYGAPPTGDNARMATYVCYKPASLITPEQLAVKLDAFQNQQNTSHDPIVFRTKPNFEPAPNDAGWKVRHAPDTRAVVSERGLKLAGVVAY